MRRLGEVNAVANQRFQVPPRQEESQKEVLSASKFHKFFMIREMGFFAGLEWCRAIEIDHDNRHTEKRCRLDGG